MISVLLPYLLVAATLSGGDEHDLHLSKAQVHYNANNSSLEVSLHIFIDDLEAAMALVGMDSLYIATNKEHPKADSLIAEYLEQTFVIAVDGRPVPFNFLGKEESDDLIAIWCYLEGLSVPPPAEVKITNQLLVDLYDDQRNMVAFTAPDLKKYFLLDTKEHVAKIRL